MLAGLEDLVFRYAEFDPHGIKLCHGSPVNESDFDYLFAAEQAYVLLPYYEELSPVTFIGHSHLCRVFALTPDTVEEIADKRFQLTGGRKYVISVGSVGQPRDRDSRACWVEVEGPRVTWHRVAYEFRETAEKINRIPLLDEILGLRLAKGM